MQNQPFAFMEDRMPGVRSALIAGNDIKALGQDVYNFSFAFVAPLGPYDDDISSHGWPLNFPFVIG